MHNVRIVARALIGVTTIALLAVTLAVPRTPAARLEPTLAAASVEPGVAFQSTDLPSQLATATAKRADAKPERAKKPHAAPDAATSLAAASASSAGQPVRRVASSTSGTELSRARALLAQHIRTHPLLTGATIEIGYAQGYQAVSYYRSGRIVVSPTHTASLERIVAHEIWHVIDWRDNGRIDWGENLPPKNASSYYTGPR